MPDKLYPPVIGTFIPAFKGTEISVPFGMNRAVSANNVTGFSLKIRTAQSNRNVLQVDTQTGIQNMINNKVAVFNLSSDQAKALKVGQYLKFQMAYIDNNNITGFYSTVAIGKYTTAPDSIKIDGLEVVEDITYKQFQKDYYGTYSPSDGDITETPYSFWFDILDQNKELVLFTSGEILHDSELDEGKEYVDHYSFNNLPSQDELYYIRYTVKTINGLETSSKDYPCIEFSQADGEEGYITAEPDFDNGYISVKFSPPKEKYVLTQDITAVVDKTYYENKNGQWIIYEPSILTNNVEGKYEKTYVGYGWENLDAPVDLWISRRTEDSPWQLMKKVRLPMRIIQHNGEGWDYKDFTVEQGITYKYQIKIITDDNESNPETLVSNEVIADFEDIFLYDGEKQLRIRFNPKISSLKKNIQEQKLDTIGSKYPHFFRNGVIQYKEFPISGLISYRVDENEFFLDWPEELGLLPAAAAERCGSPVITSALDPDTGIITLSYNDLRWQESESTDLESINIKAERIFKLRVFDWLTNGQPKLFRSATEGNYIVRLMNTSLSPEDKLGRMLHSFSSTAYEINDYNYTSLLDENLIQIEEKEPTFEQYTTSPSTNQKLNYRPIVNSVSIDGTGSVKLDTLGEVHAGLFTQTGESIDDLITSSEGGNSQNLIISYYYDKYYNYTDSNTFSFHSEDFPTAINQTFNMKNKIITKLQNNIALTNDFIIINDSSNVHNVNNIAVNKVKSISVEDFHSNFEAINIEYISKGG